MKERDGSINEVKWLQTATLLLSDMLFHVRGREVSTKGLLIWAFLLLMETNESLNQMYQFCFWGLHNAVLEELLKLMVQWLMGCSGSFVSGLLMMLCKQRQTNHCTRVIHAVINVIPRDSHSPAGTHQAITHLTFQTDTLNFRAQAWPSSPSSTPARWPACAAWKRQTQHLRWQFQHCGLLQAGDVCVQGKQTNFKNVIF